MTLKEQLKKTGRKLYVDDDVLESAPTSVSEGTLEFLKFGEYVSDDELEQEYKSRDLIPATISDLIAFDHENRQKLDEMEWVGTHMCVEKSTRTA